MGGGWWERVNGGGGLLDGGRWEDGEGDDERGGRVHSVSRCEVGEVAPESLQRVSLVGRGAAALGHAVYVTVGAVCRPGTEHQEGWGRRLQISGGGALTNAKEWYGMWWGRGVQLTGGWREMGSEGGKGGTGRGGVCMVLVVAGMAKVGEEVQRIRRERGRRGVRGLWSRMAIIMGMWGMAIQSVGGMQEGCGGEGEGGCGTMVIEHRA